MKKLFLFCMLVLMSLDINAQAPVADAADDGRYPVYCEILCSNFWGVGKVIATVDFGRDGKISKSGGVIVDDEGKNRKFTTPIGSVNYMAKRGWKYVDTYYISSLKNNVLRFVMVKYVKNEEEITEGLKLNTDDD